MPNIENNTVLIGGMGYVGSALVDYFNSKDMATTVIDNNIYSKKIKEKENNQYINIDTRKVDDLLKYNFLNKNIIILSGLVGDPITAKYPEASIEINENSLIKFISKLENYKKLIFISTCSNYGLSESEEPLNEEAALNPISLYSKSKVAVETFLTKSNKDYTILRFATAFGHSSNMRFDLTLNEFTAMQYFNKYLEVYDYETSRPYCHVKDFARVIEKIILLDKKITNKQIFNVGSDKNNISKKDLISLIAKKTGNKNYKLIEDSKDKRNYIVDFSKVKKELKFTPEFNIEDGIEEIINKLEGDEYELNKNFDMLFNYYGNYLIPKNNLEI
tara:strand:- start:242 stop:1237 length:996 start_codon:yes stop_codon:yes gene_type:complete